MRAHPYSAWTIIAVLLTAALILVVYLYTDIDPLLMYLAAINIIAFVLYKYDKLASTRRNAARVPNLMLAALAVCGGSLGAILGIHLGKQGHKTGSRYRLLRACVWLSLFVQVALLCWYLFGPVG